MIDVLGVGVPRGDGGWWLHRVCARFHAGELVGIVARRREERLALLDVVAGRVVPAEGRVWVSGLPLMRDTAARVRRSVGVVDLAAALVDARTVLWNTLAPVGTWRGGLLGLVRLPRVGRRAAALDALQAVGLRSRASDRAATLDPAERAGVAVARALVREPRHLVVRELDAALGSAYAGRILTVVRSIARHRRLTVFVGVPDATLVRPFASRIVGIADGLLVFDGTPSKISEAEVELRLGSMRSAASGPA